MLASGQCLSEIGVGFEVELSGVRTGKPYANSRPVVANRRKSAVLAVAMDAPSASAAAAIIQSINDPRRLPDALNKRAAIKACSDVKSRPCPTISAIHSISDGASGPHSNSAQATVLIPSVLPSPIQLRSLRSSGDPGCRVRIRKLVSKWIIGAWKGAAEQPSGARPATSAPTVQHRPCARAGKPAIDRERRAPRPCPATLPSPQAEWLAATLRT